MKGKTYSVVNLDEDRDAEARVIEKSGARTVPVVMVADEEGNEQVT